MITCATCGSGNPPGFRFCGSCGAELGAEATPSRETRRTVTVVFCDVTGSTALGERLDPESLRSVMARYFETMRTVLERHGGTVEKFIGDAVMAVFGVPVLHEDDALRAVRAAAEMREALAELNQELERSFGTRLLARIGVNTGEVVTGTEERLATGDAVNVAARLEQAAEPGEILVGRETYRLVRDAVDVEELAPLKLKGKSSGLVAYRLVVVRPDVPGHLRRFDAPLVGREREQRQLGDAWDRTVKERTCTLFTLLGHAGVGKSRLVAEFLRGADATVVRGRCLSYGEGITYWPVVEVLLEILGGRTVDPTEVGVDADAAARIALLFGDTAEPSSPEEIAWAVRKLFEARAAETPLIVVFDDIHWGEPTFLDLVEHVAGLSRGAPILLLCVARPELLDVRSGWGGGLLNATTVLLEPLTANEADTLIERLLGDGSIDAGFRERIRDTAGGNPLFLEEMLAMVREEEPEPRVVPPTIQALLAARIDQLPLPERAILERGSVEGEVFHRGAVASLGPDEPAAVDACLSALVRKELIRPDRPAVPGEDAYRFRHLLIRDATYDALPKATRAALHEALAGWLEQRADSLVEVDEIAGYHLEQAYRYCKELGPIGENGGTLAEEAATRLTRGGEAALERGDARAAATLLRRAVSLLPADHTSRARVALAQADALYDVGAFDESRSALAEALAAAKGLDDESLNTRVRLQELWLDVVTNPASSAADALSQTEALLARLEEAGDPEPLAQGWGLAGRLRFFLGHAVSAEEAFARAVQEARRAGKVRIEQTAYAWWIGAKLWGPASATDALAFYDALPTAILRSAQTRAFLLSVRASLSATQARFDQAERYLAEAAEIAADFGLEIRAAAQRMESGRIAGMTGDLAAAEREFRDGYDRLGFLGEVAFRATIGSQLAETLVALGRDAEAEELLEELEAMIQSDDIDPQSRLKATRAVLLSRAERHEEAVQLAREAAALWEGTDYIESRAYSNVALAGVLTAAGLVSEARDALELALRLYEQKGNVVGAGRVRSALGEANPPTNV